ncbi:branched-chain amino acid ABC transporter permease [Synergistales bacterium]|nr:branched-chain amino acid ABC transporter permease [Synergistales bacterium]
MRVYYLQLLLNGISLGSVYSIIALGFTLIYSILKFSNFSHGGIMVVSAYFGYTMCKRLGLDFVPMMLITATFGAMLSCVVQYIGFERLRKTDSNVMLFFVSSSTLGILLQNIITITFSSTYYSFPIFFKPPFMTFGKLTMAVTDLMMLAISSILIVLLMLVLYRTRLGISIRAMAMDSGTVYLMGVNVSVVIAVTFLISGALGAVAGVFCGINYALYPQLNSLVFKGMIASILGGLGNISGALYGALMLAITEVFLINFVGASLMPVFTFLFSMIFLMVRPQGITGKFVMEKV